MDATHISNAAIQRRIQSVIPTRNSDLLARPRSLRFVLVVWAALAATACCSRGCRSEASLGGARSSRVEIPASGAGWVFTADEKRLLVYGASQLLVWDIDAGRTLWQRPTAKNASVR